MSETTTETKVTVGSVAIAAIKAGKSNEEALAAVKEALPDAKTSLASINWYRNKLRADGDKTVKTARELKKAAKADAKKAEAKAPKADPLND